MSEGLAKGARVSSRRLRSRGCASLGMQAGARRAGGKAWRIGIQSSGSGAVPWVAWKQLGDFAGDCGKCTAKGSPAKRANEFEAAGKRCVSCQPELV